jgi:hypothetical protein
VDIVQLRLAGVDIIISDDGRAHLLEVNPSPGIVGVSHDLDKTKIDLRVAQAIILKCLEFAGCKEFMPTPQETVLDIELYNAVLSKVNQ